MLKLKIGGWQQKSQSVVYDNPWIQVRHEEVIRPNGTEGIYGVVHFKSHAIGVLAIDDDDMICLVRQSRYPNNETTIEIPEGGGPLDEPPLEAARRELREETGFIAQHWQPFMELRTSNSVTDEIAYIFLATGLSQGKQQLEDTEDIELITVPVSRAIESAMNGEITDAMSVAALLKLALVRQQPS
ncbi:NUDIX domain-containing protein [Amphritea pacifica]|uniref:GDP-mannose pyrophosphatase n=1 Tax=Amphritea pacifica TaxID=2811233 RepID=A0ABS2W912_9GAMM|nr:NUDIX hydrolase [Amphritea pacifica]MBN0988078.1 NUDIX hydrolase [Amphritea pacifica]